MGNSPDFDDQIVAAIRSGLDYLERTQLPSGEFATYTGPRLDLRDAVAYPKSVYLPSFVVHSLGFLPDDPRVPRIRNRVADFLEAEEVNGVWNYEGGRDEWRLPPELDTTCCAAAALLALGRWTTAEGYGLLWQVVRPNAVAAGGPYYTYIGVNDQPNDSINAPFAREIDSLVNANVLFCAGLLGIALPGAVAFLRELITAGSYTGHSFAEAYLGREPATIPPYFVLYTISRAYADGGVADLAPAVPAMREFLATRLPPPSDEVSAFNLACRAVSLLNLGADSAEVAPYVSLLLDRQRDDGGWPAWGAWAGFLPNFDGSPALTTALALEALGKWLRRSEGDRTGPPGPVVS